jgi:hypothetical protein
LVRGVPEPRPANASLEVRETDPDVVMTLKKASTAVMVVWTE